MPIPSPLLPWGVYDPVAQGFVETARKTSGIHNLAYIQFDAPIINDLAFFYEIMPYKKVAVLFGEELVRSVDPQFSQGLAEYLAGRELDFEGASKQLVLVNRNLQESLNRLPADADAVYYGFLPDIGKEALAKLVAAINEKKLPSFATDLETLNLGAMVSNATETDLDKLSRRIALNAEAIIGGQDAADLPVIIDFEERLTLNMETVDKIGFPVRWDVLTRAEVIGDEVVQGNREIDLKDVILEAKAASLSLKIENQAVASSKKDILLARGDFRPTVDLGLTGSRIDKDRALSSQGSQAETTWSGGVTVQQLIYSERARANLAIQKHLSRNTEFGRDQVFLDVVFDSGSAYLGVLRAKATVRIRKRDLQQTRRNLELSKLRESVGYSGRSDVYRWESQMATATQQVINARVAFHLSKAQLNRILNRDQDDPFRVKEKQAAERDLADFYSHGFADYLSTPKDMEILADFLTAQALSTLPERKGLEEAIAVQKRQLLSSKLARLPTAALQAQSDLLVDRTGIGSDSSLPATPEDFSWSVALNLSFPAYRGGNLAVDVAQAKIELERLETQLADLEQALELGVRTSLSRLVGSYFNLDNSKKAAALAEKSLNLVQDSYAKGAVSIVDLLDAQNNAFSSSENAAIAAYDFMEDILTLERALGEYSLLEPPQRQREHLQDFLQFKARHSSETKKSDSRQ